MLMRMQKPYEEGSIQQDAPQHDTMDELVELAQERRNGLSVSHRDRRHALLGRREEATLGW
jgi:hypothetical protein